MGILFLFVSSFQSFTFRKKKLRKIALSTWQGVPVSSPKKSLAKPESCLCSRNFKATTRRKVSVYNLWHCACLERVVFCLKEITLPRRKEQLGHGTYMHVCVEKKVLRGVCRDSTAWGQTNTELVAMSVLSSQSEGKQHFQPHYMWVSSRTVNSVFASGSHPLRSP